MERVIISHDPTSEVRFPLICLKGIGSSCLFEKGNLCTINNDKPLHCQAFPFDGSLDFIKHFTHNQKYCEGIGKGKEYSQENVELEVNKYKNEIITQNKELIANDFDYLKVFGVVPSIRIVEVIEEDKVNFL